MSQVFACINAFMVPCVYFFYVRLPLLHLPQIPSCTNPANHHIPSQPETAGRSLEEMDEIFHRVHGFKGAFTVVKVAREMPRRYGKHGELLISYDETEEAKNISERRRSSVAAQGIDGERKASAGLGEKVEDVELGRGGK